MKVFDHANHVALWEWLAANPLKSKGDWPGWEINGGEVPFTEKHCFACEYSLSLDESNNCSNCPLVWPENRNCNNVRSLFSNWLCAHNPVKRVFRSEIALQIARLPVRPGVLCTVSKP